MNQKCLIYFFCLIIILFFITIKDKEHSFLHGVSGCWENDCDCSSTGQLQIQGEWFIYAQNVTF